MGSLAWDDCGLDHTRNEFGVVGLSTTLGHA